MIALFLRYRYHSLNSILMLSKCFTSEFQNTAKFGLTFVRKNKTTRSAQKLTHGGEEGFDMDENFLSDIFRPPDCFQVIFEVINFKILFHHILIRVTQPQRLSQKHCQVWSNLCAKKQNNTKCTKIDPWW